MWHGKTSVYQDRFQDEMGIFFTEEEFPELKNAAEDVSKVLQDALKHLVEEQKYGILYIPEGEYRLKNTVLIPPSVRLIGYGATRPVFVLPAGTKGFERRIDRNTIRGDEIRNLYMDGYPGAKYLFWFIGDRNMDADEPMDANAGTFYDAISNIDFRIENNNPGAICIRAHFAQHGFISHCHFELGDGLAGIFDVGNEMEDLTFEGGQYGIVCRMCSPGWPFALLDCVFDGQKEAAVLSATTGFTAFRLRIANTKHAFDIYLTGSWEKLYLEDCVFENITDAAITSYQSDNVIQQTNIKRLRCANVPTLIHRADVDEYVRREEAYYEVEEYTRGYVYSEEQDASMQEILSVRELDRPGEMAASDIPALLPMSQWVSVKAYGAVGDGETDDTMALKQAFLDVSEKMRITGEQKALYFPQGIYRVSDTIVLPEGVSLYGFSPITTQIALTDDTPAFFGFGTPKAVVETAKGGFVCINGIGIETAGKNPRAVGVKWMAGETSYMNDVKFLGGHGNMLRDGRNAYGYLYNPSRTADYDPDRIWDFQYASLWITDGGGGVFKDVWSASPYAETGITITNTRTKGRMYAISLEHHVRSEMKLVNVANWVFYAIQTEEEKAEGLNCLPMELISCEHITFANYFLFRVIAVDRSYETGIRVWNSRDITFLNVQNKAQMHYLFTVTAEDATSGFYAKSPEYAKLTIGGGCVSAKKPEYIEGYEVLASGFDFAQGAAFDSKGNLYWCDKSQKRIYQYVKEQDIVLPFFDCHFMPSALAVDTAGNLLVAADYSELKKTVPGQPFQSHDFRNFHPFFSWFYKRSEKVYAISLENPYDTMVELSAISASACRPEVIFRPAQMDYPGVFQVQAVQKVEAYYMAPDGKTALQATIDLARTLRLDAAVEGEEFLITDDALRSVYCYEVTEGGNFAHGQKVGNKGQYGVMRDAEGIIWAVDDCLYGFRDGALVERRPVPRDAYSIVSNGEDAYLMGREHVYRIPSSSSSR
ncbi:MAG: hypothetical protein IJ833_00805 [Lachnospiraceae bacterium]|nr:hypothetical protein [Lachnospiraceae bacterium]